MPVFNNQLAGASGQGGDGYKIERSLRFDSSADSHLSRTPSSASNRKTWTWSGWVKRNKLGTEDGLFVCSDPNGNSEYATLYFNSANALKTTAFAGSSIEWKLTTSRVFRDTSAWMHIVLAVDTTQSTNSDRVKLYINGVKETSFIQEVYPSQNFEGRVNKTEAHAIGSATPYNTWYGDFLLAEIHFLDAVAPGTATDDASGSVTGTPNAEYLTDFGEFSDTGVWNPIEYEGSHNGPAVAGTSYSSATGAKSLYSTTNDGQTLGSGYSSGAIPNTTKLIIPGFNLTEGGGTSGSGQSISNNGASIVTSGTKYYGSALQFATAPQQGSSASNSLTFSQGLGLSGLDFFTLEAWVYPRSGHGHDFVIVFEGDWNNNNGLMFNLNSSRYPSLHLGNGSFQSFYSSQQVPFDQWTHVACVNLNNTISFYVNGNKDTASGTRTKNYSLGNNYRYVGAYHDSNHVNAARNPFYGYMSDIRVTSDARYTSSFTVPGGGAIPAGANGFHLDLSDPSNLGEDRSGGSNNWTVNNFVTVLGSGDYISDLSNVTNGGDYTGRYRSAFDGNLATQSYGYNYDTITWTPTGGQAYTSARVYARGESGNLNGLKYKLVGGSETTITVTTSDAWYSLPANGTIEYISWNRPGASNVTTLVGAIEINGSILVDRSQAYQYDSFVDSPTDYVGTGNNGGNYVTFNPLQISASVTLSNGNLNYSSNGNSVKALTTIGMTSGKWYAEFTSQSGYLNPGIALGTTGMTGTNFLGDDAGGWIYSSNGQKYHNDPSAVGATYGASYTHGDVIGVAFDADNGTLTFYKNGVSQGVAYTGLTSGPYFFACGGSHGSGTTGYFNGGQRPFSISSIPTGFKSLCTQNLDSPLIANPSTAFDVKLFTGNGSTNTITGLSFSPSLTWIKRRNSTSSHSIHDAVRGPTKRIRSESADAETTETTALTAFTSDGFTLGSGGTANGNNDSFVSWNWHAGSSTVSNTDGSITANVRASTSTGFSIIQFLGNGTSGASVGHGLSSAPELVIGKNRGGGDAWWVWSKAHSSNASKFLRLNLSNAETSSSYIANNTAPSSTVITLGSDYGWNSSQSPGSILFAFSPISGFSSFGTYQGNGSSDGPFIYTGFRVALLVQKRIDSSGSWAVKDAAREPYNVVDTRLYWDANNGDMQQSSHHEVDFLSNGFKVRGPGGGEDNASGGTFLYLAFAESPFKYARAN